MNFTPLEIPDHGRGAFKVNAAGLKSHEGFSVRKKKFLTGFKCIGVYGLGLLGGSILKALKSRPRRVTAYGFSRNPESLKKARRMSLIDKGFLGLDHPAALSRCDLVILTAPIRSIVAAFDVIKKCGAENIVVIDVGSTKEDIVKNADKVFKNTSIRFVGCHPMAGSEKSGLAHSHEKLFRGALCLVTPGKTSSPSSVKKAAGFWKSLGCRVETLSGSRHDQIIAKVSHFPHLVSAALVGSVDEKFFRYAGNGFRDMTRIAASNSELWKEIVFSNIKSVRRAHRVFEKNLENMIRMMNRGEEKRFAKVFDMSSAKRKRWINVSHERNHEN